MIRESKEFQQYSDRQEPINIDFKAERCFDFLEHQDIPLSTIINKGTNFLHWKIVNNKTLSSSFCWDTIEYAFVTYQDNDKTIMHLRYLTTYDSDDGNFELDSDRDIIIHHKASLSTIKALYQKEQDILNSIKHTLINNYNFSQDNNTCYYDYDNDARYKEVVLQKHFNDEQTIGETKIQIDNADKYIKQSIIMLNNAKSNKSLCFTKNGAIGRVKIQYKIQ